MNLLYDYTLDNQWHIVDGDDNIALLTTGGGGFIPWDYEEVIKYNYTIYDWFDSLNIDYGMGAEYWKSISKAGLYCYDWVNGQYVLQSKPKNPLKYKDVILKDRNVLKVGFRFENTESIKDINQEIVPIHLNIGID